MATKYSMYVNSEEALNKLKNDAEKLKLFELYKDLNKIQKSKRVELRRSERDINILLMYYLRIICENKDIDINLISPICSLLRVYKNIKLKGE